MKKFIITIDAEGDNLWNWAEGKEITVNNVYYLQRFQDLCDKYHFKPVWLSNWEMVQNEDYVKFIKRGLESGTCELGMHLHAWNTPPFFALPKCDVSGAPYLIEYPVEIMEEKIKNITELIRQKFGFTPVSHRAGRWAMNNIYFGLLSKYGYQIDCSYTPGISWESSSGQTPGFGGVDYRKVFNGVQKVNGVLEIPVTIRHTNKVFWPERLSIKTVLRTGCQMIKGKNIWMRPDGRNVKELFWLADKQLCSEDDYLMFMLHSSELMPGGSPIFQTKESIERLYRHLEMIFEKVAQNYVGSTLAEYKGSHYGEC